MQADMIVIIIFPLCDFPAFVTAIERWPLIRSHKFLATYKTCNSPVFRLPAMIFDMTFMGTKNGADTPCQKLFATFTAFADLMRPYRNPPVSHSLISCKPFAFGGAILLDTMRRLWKRGAAIEAISH